MNVKNWLTKVDAIKDLVGNPSNCESECDKPCDIRKYTDDKNCKCRKKLVYKVVEKCSKNINEIEMISVTLNDYGSVYNSRRICIALFSIAFFNNNRH